MRAMRFTAVLAGLALLCGCPRSERTSSSNGDAAASGVCVRVGQRCEFSPGKLGTCVSRDDCNDPAGCFVCQSQH
jgi:hypothetical protein